MEGRTNILTDSSHLSENLLDFLELVPCIRESLYVSVYPRRPM